LISLHSVGNRWITEYGSVCGMTLTGNNRTTRRKKTCPEWHFVHHKSHT